MNEFEISPNKYLNESIRAFYHVSYFGMGNPGNPDYLNALKNTYNNFSENKLSFAVQELRNVLLANFSQILQLLNLRTITVCIVPRAKAEVYYHANQLLFHSTVRAVTSQLNGFEDGANYLCRHTNTRTTHLRKSIQGYDNDGAEPHPGITVETCDISIDVRGKNIFLVDDIYTPAVNIDEDAIQALINAGACSVAFYAVARTERRSGP